MHFSESFIRAAGPLIGFFLHAAVIYGGARLQRLPGADYVRCLGVAAVSYAAMFFLILLINPFTSAPVLSTTLGSVLMAGGTAFAAKYVLPTEWLPAAVIGLFAGWPTPS